MDTIDKEVQMILVKNEGFSLIPLEGSHMRFAGYLLKLALKWNVAEYNIVVTNSIWWVVWKLYLLT